jgi:hypothetical protein
MSRSRTVRQGWEEAAIKMAVATDDVLIEGAVLTRFEREEWKWELVVP